MVTDKKAGSKLFALCWLFYFTSYLGRYNYSGAMAELISKNIFTEPMGGFIATLYFSSYAIGQIVSGYFADKKTPEKMIFLGLFGSAICNLSMALCENYILMCTFWFINGFMQSMIWSPVVAIFTKMFPENRRVSCFTHITSSIAIGTLTSYMLTSLSLSISGWKLCFIMPSIILILVAFFGYRSFRKIRLTFSVSEQPEIGRAHV